MTSAAPEIETPSRKGILRPAQRPLATVLVTTVATIVILCVGLVLKLNPLDFGVVAVLNDAHVGFWGSVCDGVYRVLSPVPAAIGIGVLVLVLWASSRSWRTAVAFGGTVVLTWLPVALFKVLIDRPRPDVTALAHAYSPAQVDGSYPSGHTAFIVALAISGWFLLRDSGWRWLIAGVGVIATTLVGLAVVGDGLHYPTDVLASVAWCLAMAPTARLLVVDVMLARTSARDMP